ncbi:hypothetical protein Aristophanes_00031 [Acinetobacter phage Aristophanes]|uniref:Uncharacterized protein n=1 Tax=Acinetobacter phage Aristophanes TaxID=2759203 RepID=A0A7G9VYP0_BPACA|nr:hypothetical protein Aristophanes_00031 [Acinetobacter phage Aristophanes]
MILHNARGSGRTTRMLWAAAQAAQHKQVCVVANTNSQLQELERYAHRLFSPNILQNMKFVAVFHTGMEWTSDMRVVRLGQGEKDLYVDHRVYEAKLEGLQNLITGATKYDL